MNADLLAMLSGAGGSSRGGSGPGSNDNGKSILSFKAGIMKTELRPNGKYLVSPDPRRGQIDLVWQVNGGTSSSSGSGGGLLKFEWKDRRTRSVVESLSVFPEDDFTYERVETGRENDRVYLLQHGRRSDRRFFFWMQDGEVEKDEDNCVKANLYLSDRDAASAAASSSSSSEEEGDSGTSSGGGAPSGNTSGGSTEVLDARNLGGASGGRNGLDNNALMQIMRGLGNEDGTGSRSSGDPSSSTGGSAAAATSEGGTSGSSASSVPTSGTEGQVDALSNILQNLGMPQPSSGGTGTSSSSSNPPSSAEASAPTPSAPAATGGGTLTLADLQGAMAGLATSSPLVRPQIGPNLAELATPDAVSESGILSDPELRSRLVALLPEGQNNDAALEENLRSPQVSQCLKSLTAALMPDEDGSMEGFHSVLANFRLEPADGAASMASGNPIQAFLDCVMKSVEREQEKKKEENEGEEKEKGDDKDGDAKMEE